MCSLVVKQPNQGEDMSTGNDGVTGERINEIVAGGEKKKTENPVAKTEGIRPTSGTVNGVTINNTVAGQKDSTKTGFGQNTSGGGS